MNLALDRYADNPIIDELVFWPPKPCRIESVRACNVLFRKPFIEVTMADGKVFQRHFPRESFTRFWAEASIILETLTHVRLISDFSYEPSAHRERMVEEIMACRDECIEESNLMFDEGMYSQFLLQYGEDYRDLPEDSEQKIAYAKQQLGLST